MIEVGAHLVVVKLLLAPYLRITPERIQEPYDVPETDLDRWHVIKLSTCYAIYFLDNLILNIYSILI